MPLLCCISQTSSVNLTVLWYSEQASRFYQGRADFQVFFSRGLCPANCAELSFSLGKYIFKSDLRKICCQGRIKVIGWGLLLETEIVLFSLSLHHSRKWGKAAAASQSKDTDRMAELKLLQRFSLDDFLFSADEIWVLSRWKLLLCAHTDKSNCKQWGSLNGAGVAQANNITRT